MNKSIDLYKLGQSIWYDNIQRSLLKNGTLAKWIHEGKIYGITSNPSIFNNAIAKSADYDMDIQSMSWSGLTAEEILDRLTIDDIRMATDQFLDLYHRTKGTDGFVSIEVSPLFANDTEKTIAEAKRLWAAVDRPNLMVKIPATKEGLPAIQECIASGININITLIFSLDRYKEVLNAYLTGLEQRLSRRLPIEHISSVASFFVSRVDTKVDARLAALGANRSDPNSYSDLMGKAAIANAKLAYQLYLESVKSKRFQMLAPTGVVHQRPLWASTSTKNPAYRDVIYVEGLIGRNTVNTVPEQTLMALLDHSITEETITQEVSKAREVLESLEKLGISMAKVTHELEIEGVAAFSTAYESLLNSLKERIAQFVREPAGLLSETKVRVAHLKAARTSERLFQKDASLWTDDPVAQAEINKRLGWLDLPRTSKKLVQDIQTFKADIQKDGYDTAVLLGMGGSSLAPELYGKVFGVKNGMRLLVLDSTDPGQVLAIAKKVKYKNTLFIVSSKSGGTAEVNAFLNYFWSKCHRVCGENTGRHFIAITDPGTSLEKVAADKKFRKVFFADPTVGGRYSALTIFGLLPAGLIGVDLTRLLSSANDMMQLSRPDQATECNPGLVLGAMVGQAALSGRDKLTVICDRGYESFGDWLEQLVAESSGKQGRGIIPVVGEKVQPAKCYQNDRIFVYLRSDGKFDGKLARLTRSGFPVLVFPLTDAYDLGGEFYRWESAAAVACSIIRVNAFDQPDVQDNKTRTVDKINGFIKSKRLQEPEASWSKNGVQVFTSATVKTEGKASIHEVVEQFLALAQPGDYLALNSYLPYHRNIGKSISQLREYLMKTTRMAVTTGYGPRFLHSTGQLHKGGANNGLFIQFTSDPVKDVKYDRLTFGTLERAQALGDFESLVSRGRRIIRIQFSENEFEKLITEIIQG